MSWWRDVFFLKIRGTEVSKIFNVRRRSAVFTRTAGIATQRGKEPSSCAEKIDSGSACSEFRIDLTTQQVELSLKININIHVQ